MLQRTSEKKSRKDESSESSIMLRSGRLFDFADPEANEIGVEDIAHGLAHTCRYAGQCNSFYSVAEHSVLVSQIVPTAKLAGLFHDAAEAFIGDISAPLKRLLPDYKLIEKRVERAIFAQFGIELPLSAEVKVADLSVMAAELLELMPPRTNEWLRETDVVPAAVKIRKYSPDEAKVLFLERYAELRDI